MREHLDTVLEDAATAAHVLQVRPATPDDRAALADFNARTHGALLGNASRPFEAWSLDLTSNKHPRADIDNFLIVPDARGGILAALCMIPQTWTYGDCEISVGRIELVGTDPKRRGQGMVRRLMKEVESQAQAQEIDLLCLTGLPGFYRQFGYEYALPFAFGNRLLAPEATEPRPTLTVRSARLADAEEISRLANRAGRRRGRISVLRQPADVAWEIDGQSRESQIRLELAVGVDRAGRIEGVIGYLPRLIDGDLWVGVLEADPERSAHASFFDAALHYLRARQAELGARNILLQLWAGPTHPIDRWAPPGRLGAAWYLRVLDLPSFLNKVSPAVSAQLRHMGDPDAQRVYIDLFTSGFTLDVSEGRVKAVPERLAGAHTVTFPGQTFLQLLFGARSLTELEDSYPDCRASHATAAAMLDRLFPRAPAFVWPIA